MATIFTSRFLLIMVVGIIQSELSFGLQKENTRNVKKEESKFHGMLAGEHPSSESELGVYDNGAVSSDGVPCSQIGADILSRNGTAADAAIASLFCLGVVNCQSMGIGGGFFALYYQKSTRQVFALDARESAPEAATEDMYEIDSSSIGGKAVAVPGELRGYYALYETFGGGVTWAELIEPTITLCEEGFPVNAHMAFSLSVMEDLILLEPTMSVFVNSSTGMVLEEGDTLFRTDLAATLRIIQNDPDAIYSGSLSDGFVQDLQNLDGIITKNDMLNYRPIWKEPVSVDLGSMGFTVYSMPPPGSGSIYEFMLNILENYEFNASSLEESETITTHQRITESFKYAYAKRTELGDPDYVDMEPLMANLTSEAYAFDIFSRITDNETFQDPGYYGATVEAASTYGTSHLSVLAPSGDAVSVTSTVNRYYGAVIMSNSTGIIYNDEMDDFSSPNNTGGSPSPNNYIVPGKRPLSSMCPSIVLNNTSGDVRLVIGAAGGSLITSATAFASANNLWFGKNIKESIDAKRLHHDLFPMTLQYETGFNQTIIDGLRAIGHDTDEFASTGSSVVTGIERGNDGKLYANGDGRKQGEVSGV